MRYSEWKPTGFDPAGLGLENRQDWVVAPVIQTRDSGPLERSNFRTVLADLGGESDTVEVHRFGHWGPGWFEIILVCPERADTVDEWERALADYPVASDEDHSELEWEECSEVWSNCYSDRERLAYLRDHVRDLRGVADILAAVRGSWSHAGNLLPCPGDLIY